MIFRKKQLPDHVARVTVGDVVDSLALLVLHHVLLVEKSLLRYGWQQVSHAVCFEPQRHLERVVGHDLEVDRIVVAGAAVQGPTSRLDLAEELVFAHVL